MTSLSLLLAIALDWLLGEPRRWHPLVGFGRLADRVERLCRGGPETASWRQRLRGIFAISLLLTPPTLLLALLSALPLWGDLIGVAALYFSIGHRSLHDHARPVAEALAAGGEEEARRLAGRLVSRDPETLHIPAATTESVLENGNDAVFGALFWFLAAGAPGAACYRLANTLDAMWGYKSERYLHFGWAAARLDDLLNYLPARLTALTYALMGDARQALRCWRGQAPAWESPNAGPVMAAGAGALGIRLGGPARYRGDWHRRPDLGLGRPVEARDIARSLALVRRGVALWLAVVFLVEGLAHV